MSVPENEAAQAATDPSTPLFTLQKIYLKDVSFESPMAPEVFMREWSPKVDVRFDTSTKKLADVLFEVSLTATVTVTVEDKTAYLIEVTQAGLFQISGYDDEELKGQIATTCPSILFPYIRVEVAQLAADGGFPQMLLTPMNFDALYEEHLTQEGQS